MILYDTSILGLKCEVTIVITSIVLATQPHT